MRNIVLCSLGLFLAGEDFGIHFGRKLRHALVIVGHQLIQCHGDCARVRDADVYTSQLREDILPGTASSGNRSHNVDGESFLDGR